MSKVNKRREEIRKLNTDALQKLSKIKATSGDAASAAAALHLGSIGEALWEIAETLDDIKEIALRIGQEE